MVTITTAALVDVDDNGFVYRDFAELDEAQKEAFKTSSAGMFRIETESGHVEVMDDLDYLFKALMGTKANGQRFNLWLSELSEMEIVPIDTHVPMREFQIREIDYFSGEIKQQVNCSTLSFVEALLKAGNQTVHAAQKINPEFGKDWAFICENA